MNDPIKEAIQQTQGLRLNEQASKAGSEIDDLLTEAGGLKGGYEVDVEAIFARINDAKNALRAAEADAASFPRDCMDSLRDAVNGVVNAFVIFLDYQGSSEVARALTKLDAVMKAYSKQ